MPSAYEWLTCIQKLWLLKKVNVKKNVQQPPTHNIANVMNERKEQRYAHNGIDDSRPSTSGRFTRHISIPDGRVHRERIEQCVGELGRCKRRFARTSAEALL